MKPKLKVDRQANAAYLRFSMRKVARTVMVSGTMNVDYDVSEGVIGVEFLNVGWTANQLETSYIQGIIDGLREAKTLASNPTGGADIPGRFERVITVMKKRLFELTGGK